MSRRKAAEKRPVQPDPRFQSTLVTKFINSMMLDGKKSKAENIFYRSLTIVEEKTGQPGLNVFKQAVNNAKTAGGSQAGQTDRPGAALADRIRQIPQ